MRLEQSYYCPFCQVRRKRPQLHSPFVGCHKRTFIGEFSQHLLYNIQQVVRSTKSSPTLILGRKTRIYVCSVQTANTPETIQLYKLSCPTFRNATSSTFIYLTVNTWFENTTIISTRTRSAVHNRQNLTIPNDTVSDSTTFIAEQHTAFNV